MKTKEQEKFWFLLTVIYVLILTHFSLKVPPLGEEHSPIKETIHNLTHVPAYMILTYLLLNVFYGRNPKFRVEAGAFSVSFLYGIVLEILQGFVPGRTPSWLDIFSNGIGAILIVMLFKRQWIKL